MADGLMESKFVTDKIPALNPMRTHSRNLSWGGQGTPLARKLSASPKVLNSLSVDTKTLQNACCTAIFDQVKACIANNPTISHIKVLI